MVPPRLRRALAALALSALGSAAAAECAGPSFLDRLEPEKLAGLQAAAAATPFGQGLLWMAERGEARVLIAGTMHLPDPRHDATLAALAPAIQDADLVLLEMTPAEEEAMAQAIASHPEIAVITDGPTLPELLAPADWERVAQAARDRGIPPFMAAKYRPWLLMLTLSLPPCALEGLVAGAGGLDHMVMGVAEGVGTPMAPLERWDTLFGLMAGGTMEEQLDILKLSLVDTGPAEEMLVAMREGYFAGRIAEVWELSRLSAELVPADLLAESGATFAAMEDQLLTQRNLAWIPVIEEAAAANPRLIVAAGAAHLPGERGVLRLLEDRGWRVGSLDGVACCEGFWDAP